MQLLYLSIYNSFLVVNIEAIHCSLMMRRRRKLIVCVKWSDNNPMWNEVIREQSSVNLFLCRFFLATNRGKRTTILFKLNGKKKEKLWKTSFFVRKSRISWPQKLKKSEVTPALNGNIWSWTEYRTIKPKFLKPNWINQQVVNIVHLSESFCML